MKTIGVRIEHYENTRPVQVRVADWPNGEWKTETVQVPDMSKPSRVSVSRIAVPAILSTAAMDFVRDGVLPLDMVEDVFGR
jgi:hypothetical protein